MIQDELDQRVEVLVGSKVRFLQFLERRLGNRADAEDVLQAAFLKLVAREGSLRDEDKLVPWFYQLLRNLIIDHYRHCDAVNRLEQSVAAEAAPPTTGMDDALFTAVCTCVNGLIPALKAEQAELVRRVELGEEPLHQVASDLGLTPNNASVRLHRARRALRGALQDACGACADHGCLDCGCRSVTPRSSRSFRKDTGPPCPKCRTLFPSCKTRTGHPSPEMKGHEGHGPSSRRHHLDLGEALRSSPEETQHQSTGG